MTGATDSPAGGGGAPEINVSTAPARSLRSRGGGYVWNDSDNGTVMKFLNAEIRRTNTVVPRLLGVFVRGTLEPDGTRLADSGGAVLATAERVWEFRTG